MFINGYDGKHVIQTHLKSTLLHNVRKYTKIQFKLFIYMFNVVLVLQSLYELSAGSKSYYEYIF